ncbi:conserved hypothetical protein [Solidesulfovibrio fructosivorans JJ]]|uniref:Uncharacterized protein n=1 Tax=Solidesulfovibrio fructosivorans JJ] TaxID=596151 RepID=E1K1T8_SOLFR|nr:hypothetical protein [Solidesulfovibrio fructosivorans]EFL49438.1 conserved hypothetical protein [Solidesulfovibrio fructosivorans JJ]]
MKRLAVTALLLAFLGVAGAVRPAAAFNEEAVLACAFRQALAILTCKNPQNYEFIGVREGVYIFNSFFAKGFAEFYVQMNGDMAIFSSRVWHGRMSSGRVVRDMAAGCITVVVDPLPCSKTTVARCCGSP